VQVYYGLRAGMHDVALRAAERAMDYSQRGAAGSSVKQLLQAWLGNAAGFRANHGARMVQECERLLQGYNQKQVGFRVLLLQTKMKVQGQSMVQQCQRLLQSQLRFN
jgi:hypothetical protein